MARTSKNRSSATLAAAEVAAPGPTGGDHRVLVLEDPTGEVAAAARSAGRVTHVWSRRLPELPLWPGAADDDAVFDLVVIRLPRARDEFDMLLHMAADRLGPGGRLLVHGANDEGIRSAPARISALFGDCTTLGVGGHGRLLGAVRPPQVDGLRTGVDAWREVPDVEVPWHAGGGAAAGWVSYPGVFAHGRLDGATALLATHLPVQVLNGVAQPRVLDWGTGSGYLAAAVLAAAPTAEVHAVDVDAFACAAVRENVPRAVVHHGDAAAIARAHAPFDVIVSNPSYHDGKSESMLQIESLLGAAATSLAPQGVLRFVVQRRLQPEAVAQVLGLTCAPVADEGAFRVWEVRR